MKGWGFPGNSRKAHYFEFEGDNTGGRSLCGKWVLLFTSQDYLENNKHEHKDNCTACIKKLKKLHPEFFLVGTRLSGNEKDGSET